MHQSTRLELLFLPTCGSKPYISFLAVSTCSSNVSGEKFDTNVNLTKTRSSVIQSVQGPFILFQLRTSSLKLSRNQKEPKGKIQMVAATDQPEAICTTILSPQPYIYAESEKIIHWINRWHYMSSQNTYWVLEEYGRKCKTFVMQDCWKLKSFSLNFITTILHDDEVAENKKLINLLSI